jgi:hypothetical protein
MEETMFSFVSALALTLLPLMAHAATEPRFCDPNHFSEYERGNNIAQLKRVHVYQLGQLTLVGLAVGGSDYRYVQSLAKQYNVTDNKSCTWYLNQGNPDASVAFNHYNMPAPYFANPSIALKYEKILKTVFDQAPNNMLECARKYHYVAMGCDGQMHRGPSVFAMYLSYAGCSAQHSMEIANKVWGANFVPKETRKAIAAVGGKFGDENPAGRAELQAIMGVQ